MRFTGGQTPISILHAYLNISLPTTALDKIYADFSLGSHAFSQTPEVRLEIHDEERFHGKTAEEIRTILDGEGADIEDFILIEKDVEDTGAVWYIGEWDDGSEDVVHHGDERVLWKLRVMTKAVPSRWIDYSIANTTIQEDIDQTTTYPYDPHAPQTPYTIDIDDSTFMAPAYIIAEPGEFEEGPGRNLDVDPPQEKVYRLKDEVATQYGLRSGWAIGWKPSAEDGATEGSMCFAQEWR